MSEEEFNKVFSKRLVYYLNKYEMTQNDLAKRLGVGTTSVSNWCRGLKSPRMDKVDSMCKIFNCRRSDLMEEKDDSQDDTSYYLNDDTRDMVQEMNNRPELKVVFDATRKLSTEDLQFVKDMINKLSRD